MTADAVGGVWTYALALARALGDAGVEVTLAVMGPPPDAGQWAQARAIPTLAVHTAPFRLEWMDDPWSDVDAAGDWLLDLERQYAPQIVHLNGYAHGTLGFRAPKLVVAHSCVYSWWRAVRGGAPPVAEWSVYRQRVAAGLGGAHAIAAPTRCMLSGLRADYLFVPPPAFVIRNGRVPSPSAGNTKEPFVFFGGRLWDEAKNVGLLLDAAPAIPWPVIVAGETSPPRGAHGAGVGLAPGADRKNVRLAGQLSAVEMAGALARASIFVSPARYEPFGLAVLEAAASGCALALADIPSLRELWNGAATFFSPDSRDQLVDAVGGLIDDPSARDRAANKARERSLSYSAARMRDEYLDVYQALSRGARLEHSDGEAAMTEEGVSCES